MRQATIERSTNETQIRASVNLDGQGIYDVETGIGFLDHMLEQLSRHSLIDLTVRAKGDLHIDYHHTTEDTGIAIGQAVAKALNDRRGIVRYGSALIPMDETLTRVALDLSNRPYLRWMSPGLSWAKWTPNCSRSGFRRSRNRQAQLCMLRTYMARTPITLSNPVLKAWHGLCVWRLNRTRGSVKRFHLQKVR